MEEFRLTYSQTIQRTADIFSFRFIPQTRIDFCAGQFFQVIFDEKDRKNRSLNKYLSFSCSPSKPYIEVTKKNTGSPFSQKLLGLKPGDTVLGSGPLGQCLVKQDERKLCFIAGGIGITPVISMVEDMAEKNALIELPLDKQNSKSPNAVETAKERFGVEWELKNFNSLGKINKDITLLFSCLEEGNIPFRQQLDAWQKASPLFKVVYTVTQGTPKDKNIHSGFITKEFIQEQVPELLDRSFFIFGPPGMVTAMEKVCRDCGLSPDKIHTEKFAGYE
jgi:ferredoxin-NADP reductase